MRCCPSRERSGSFVSRFATAFQAGDIEGVIALFTDDALMTMPPEAAEYHGPVAIGRFLSTVPAAGALERWSASAWSRHGPTVSRPSGVT